MKQSAYFVEEAEEYMTECHPISSSNRALKQCHHARLDLFGEDKTELCWQKIFSDWFVISLHYPL